MKNKTNVRAGNLGGGLSKEGPESNVYFDYITPPLP